MPIQVRVMAYKKYIIIQTVDPRETPGFKPINEQRVGNVVLDTKNCLGMSMQAWKLMKTIRKGWDDIGDVMAFIPDSGSHCFGWLGGFNKILHTERAEFPNDGYDEIEFRVLANRPPQSAVDRIKEIEQEAIRRARDSIEAERG